MGWGEIRLGQFRAESRPGQTIEQGTQGCLGLLIIAANTDTARTSGTEFSLEGVNSGSRQIPTALGAQAEITTISMTRVVTMIAARRERIFITPCLVNKCADTDRMTIAAALASAS